MPKISLTLCFVLFAVGCTKSNLMNQPIIFDNQNELYRLLEEYKTQLNEQNYLALTDAIAFLKTVDTQNYNLESFYHSINNQSPDEIIKRAESMQTQSMKLKN